MAAPETENYLSVYRQFLEEFTSSVYANDPLPVKVTGYLLDEADLEGEIIDWTRQYLSQRSCPPALATSVARSVLGELQNVIKDYHELRSHDEEEKDPLVPLRKRVNLQQASQNAKGPHYDPLRLMHAVVAKVRSVCVGLLRELDGCDGVAGHRPSKASELLPSPLLGPPFVSTHAIKNHRRRMEDRHVAIEDLNALFGITNSPCLVGYYAIFDGHHGHEAAAYSAAQLHCLLVHSKHYPQNPEAALKDAFFRADENFIKKCASSKFLSGTTALVALVRHRESLHVAWVGDSLGIIVQKGGKISQFVNPHTAERSDERDRILSDGGAVFQHYGVWRINGTLAISRAIGDPDCKPHVSALADVVSYPLDGSEHFIILACDGLWDCVEEERAAAYVYEHLRKEPDNHADLSKELVNLAKQRGSNDNISVVVVLLSSVEDILASAPPPASLALDVTSQGLDELFGLTTSPADGLAPDGAPTRQLPLVNGAMDMEAATSAADPSSNPFAAPFKPSPAGPPDSAPSPDGLHADGDFNNHHLHHDNDDSGLHDEEDGLAYNHDLHHSHHNGHGANDIMTSSFYGNGDGNRDLFGDPEDLGPETHVDLLDDQDGMMMDMGQAAEEEYKARAMEFGIEDQHGAMRHDPYSKDGYLAEGGDYVSSNRVDMIITEEQETMLEEEGREVEDDVDRVMVHQEVGEGYNPFKAEDWALPKSEQKVPEEVFGGEGVDATQFAEEPSTRQHYDGERQERLLPEEEEEVGVIQYKEEPALEKEQVVRDEEVIEVGGGSGLEEADDDSEEEGEWKYVSAKPGEGGAVVPEAISPEAALPDETSCSPALPEQELLEQQHLSPSASPALPPRLEHGTVETAKVEELEIKSDTSDLKAEEAIADDDKFCQDLGFEVVQKTHVEEVCEAGVLEKPVEQERESLGLPELDLLGGKSPQLIEEETEDSTMESRLNPDAAEFVPVSPTQLVSVEAYPVVDDFDTFKKEAGECPGEISEDPATPRTPKAFLNIGVNDDVLSSSFGHGTPKHADVFQEELSSNVPDLMSSGNEYLMNDDDKENISQEGEDKENMSQQITVSDVDSALNRSFEVREELSSGNEKIADFLGSPVNFSAPESKDESEIVCETSGRDVMSEFVSGTSEPETSLHEVPSHEISALHEVVNETADLAAQILQSEEVSFNQSNDFMHSSHEEDFMKQQDIQENQSKDEEHIGEHFQMEFSPVKHTIPPVKPMEEAELVMVHPETPENLEPTPSPNLQICPMKIDDLMESSEPEVKEEPTHSQFVVEDFQNKEHPDDLMFGDRQVNIPVETMEHIQTHEADMTTFNAEPSVKVEQEFAPVENVEPALEPICKSPIFPSSATELSEIIEGSKSLSLEEKVPAVEEKIQKIEDEIIESINASSEVEVVQEIIQSFENDMCSPLSEKVTSTELAVDEISAKEQITSEVITPADVSVSEPLVEDLPKETVTESIPEDDSKAADIASAAAVAAAVGAAVTAAGVVSSAKTAPKKSTTADKKPLSDKSKPSSAAAAKPTTKTTKPPATAASKTTAAPKKPAAPSTNKTAPVPAARTSTAERKPLTSTTKPAPTSKPSPASTTSLASKAKTLGAKPSAASTTKAGALPRTSAPPGRPSSAAPKTSTTTAASKPAPSRPTTAPAKTAEPKKMMNGDATKPAPTTTTRAPLTKKPTTTSTTTTSKTATTTTTRVSLSARSATSKTAADPAKTSTKPAAGAVNGAVPKTTPRTSLAPKPGAATAKPSAPAAKPSAAATARTKPSTTPQKTTPTAPGIAKKAKESVNKHISATRLSGVGSAKQSAISKTESPKSATKAMTNGTPGKKPEAKSNSKVVEAEEKELRINGITLDCNNEKLDGVVAIEDDVHEAKEQMVLMGDALSIGEAV